MRLIRYCIFFTLLSLLGLGPHASFAQEVRVVPGSGVNIQVSSLYTSLPNYGFYPIKVRIQNRSGKTRSWHLHSVCTTNYSGSSKFFFESDLKVENGAERNFEFYIPIRKADTRKYGGGLTIRVSGYGVESSRVYRPFFGKRYKLNNQQPFILMSAPLALRSWKVIEADIAKKKGEILRGGTLSASFWPVNWRAYLGISSLILKVEEWNTLRPQAQEAIADWVSIGGNLVLFHKNSLRGAARNYGFFYPSKANDQGKVAEYGLGSIHFYVWDGIEIPSLFTYEYLLGQKSKPSLMENLSNGYQSWNLANAIPKVRFSAAFIVILSVMVLFYAVIVGPLNVFIFAGRNERLLLFVTTPIIALFASLIFFLLVMIRDGFGGWGMRTTGVFINPKVKKAVIVQEQVAKTSLLFNSSFTLPGEVFINPVQVTEKKQADGSLYVDSAGEYSGAWFSNRRVQGHLLVSHRSSRAGVEISPGSFEEYQTDEMKQTLEIVSRINSPLSSLYVFDRDGRCWFSRGVPVGQVRRMGLVSGNFCLSEIRAWVNANTGKHLREALEKVYHKKNVFFAIAADDAGFGIETLDKVSWKKQNVIFYGPLSRVSAEEVL